MEKIVITRKELQEIVMQIVDEKVDHHPIAMNLKYMRLNKNNHVSSDVTVPYVENNAFNVTSSRRRKIILCTGEGRADRMI